MVKAIDVARFLLFLASCEPEPEPLTPLRLQKLLYYAQGWSMGLRSRPLFSEAIEAWDHGPVVREVYREFADQKDQPIGAAGEADSTALSREDRDFVRSIWEHYKQYSAGKLRAMTHDEEPWRRARGDCRPGERCRNEIAHADMLRHFESEFRRQSADGPSLERVRIAERELESADSKPLEYLADRIHHAVSGGH